MSTTRIKLPEGRIVQGHPFERQMKTDENNKPIMNAQGVQESNVFFAYAIPKSGEPHWNQTVWGAQIDAQAKEPEHGYPNGEWQRADFSWKIEDGDSTIPNKNGIANSTREGFPGHWVLKCSTNFDVPCYPQDSITDDSKFTTASKLVDAVNYPKRGDYFVAILDVKGNKPAKSPGVYLNPVAVVRTRPGAEIVSEGAVSANEVASLFGGGAPAPTPAPVTAPPSAPATMPPPAHDLVNAAPPPVPAPVETMWTYGGQSLTESAWIAAGWTKEALEANATKG